MAGTGTLPAIGETVLALKGQHYKWIHIHIPIQAFLHHIIFTPQSLTEHGETDPHLSSSGTETRLFAY